MEGAASIGAPFVAREDVDDETRECAAVAAAAPAPRGVVRIFASDAFPGLRGVVDLEVDSRVVGRVGRGATNPVMALSADLAAGKVYPAGALTERDIISHLNAPGLLRSSIKVGVLRTLGYLATDRPFTATEWGKLRGHELATAKLVAKKLGEGVAKDMGKDVVRKAYENFFLRNMASSAAFKFVKSVSASAKRKALRDGRLLASMKVAKTGLLAGFLEHAAIFTIEVGVNCFVALYRALRPLWKKGANSPEVRGEDSATPVLIRRTPLKDVPRLLDTTLDMLWRCSASVLGEAAGASVGTLVLPGIGTTVGALIGGTVFYLI